MGKNLSVKQFWARRWVRFARLRHAVSAIYLQCLIQCIFRLDATPRHSMMQKFSTFLLNNFGSRDGFDWNNYDTLSVPHVCVVRQDEFLSLSRHPDIRTCHDAKIFPSEQFRIWRLVGFARLRHAVSAHKHLHSE